jgi:hypothetical protein
VKNKVFIPAAQARSSGLRIYPWSCWGAGVLVNYFDRINLSVGAPQLQREFGRINGELGRLFQRVLLVLRAAADPDRHDP